MESRKTVNKFSSSERLRYSSAEGVTEFQSLPATLSNPNSLNDEELASVPIVSTNLKDAFLDKICFNSVSLERRKTFSGLDSMQSVSDKQRDAFHEQRHDDQDSILSDQSTDNTDCCDEDLESDNAVTCIKDNTSSKDGISDKVEDDNSESIHSIEMQVGDLPRIKLSSPPSKQPNVFEVIQEKIIHHSDESQIRNGASTGKAPSGDECATCDDVRYQPFDKKCNEDSESNAEERKDQVKEIKTSDKDLSKINPNFQESRFKQPDKQVDEKNVSKSKDFKDESEELENYRLQRQDCLLRNNKNFAESKCVVCGVHDAIIHCDTCENARCETCDIKWHNHSERKMHQRKNQTNPLNVIQMPNKELPNIRLRKMSEELKINDQPSTKQGEKTNLGESSQFQVEPKRPLMESENDVVQDNSEDENKTTDDKCVICGLKDAIIHCEVCGDSRCEVCDIKWHNHSERKMHQRKDKPNVITMQIQDLPNIRINPDCQNALFNLSGNQESEAINSKKLDSSENIRSPQSVKEVKPDNSDCVMQDKCAICGIKDAIVSCNKCGDARCQHCDVKWHNHRERKKHQRISQPNLENKIIMRVTELPNIRVHPSFSQKPLVSTTKRGMCMTCGIEEATLISNISGDPRCQQCDVKLHLQSSRNAYSPSRQPVMVSNTQFEGSAISKSYVKSEDILAFSKKQSEALQSKPAYLGHQSKAVELEKNQSTEKKDPCVLCGVEDATVTCVECDDARCVQCDEKWHRHKKRNKHKRNQASSSPDSGSSPRTQSHVGPKTKKSDLPSNQQNRQEPDNAENKPLKGKCVTCKLEDAIIECDDCEDARCQSCDLKWHSRSDTSMHQRKNGINLENNIQKHIKIFDMKFAAPHTEYKPKGNVTDEKPKFESKPAEKKQPCVLCGVEDAIIPCDECGDARCVQCDMKWHRHKKRDKHKRNQAVVSTDSMGSSSSSDSTCSPPVRGTMLSMHIGLQRNDQKNLVKTQCDSNGEMVNNIPASGHYKEKLKTEIYPQPKSTDRTEGQDQQRNKSNQKHEIIMNINNLPMIRDDSCPQTQPAQSRQSVRHTPKEKLRKVEKELCILCGVEDATVPCDECGDARCIQCDVKWHRHKKRITHKRNQAVESSYMTKNSHEEGSDSERSIDEQRNCRQTINSTANEKTDFSDQGLGEDIELCALCGQVDGTIECIECKDSRCGPCDTKWHKNAKRKMHQRRVSDILKEIVEQDIDPNSTKKTSQNITFSNESRDINSGTFLKKPSQGASSVECTDRNTFPSHKEPLKNLQENYESATHMGDADVQLSISLDESFNNATQTLKSKNENIFKEINSIQIKLDAMDREHYKEEYDELVTKKSELLKKQKMFMVRMKAIEVVEITNSRQGHRTSLPQGELISRGMHDHCSEQFHLKKPDAFTKSLSAHYTEHIVDDDISTDGPSEHEHVTGQQGIVLNQGDEKHLIQEAKRRGFTTDDIHIAKAQCKISGGNILHWLEFYYKEFIASVRTSATRDLHRLIPSVKIAESSVIRALVKHPGDVRKATNTCVRKVEAQICEIHQLGLRKDTGMKLTMQEVAEYLFKCSGNVEMVMEMMKKDGIKIDITEKVWRTYDEREIAHVLMKKPGDPTQIQKRKRLIMAEYGLSWDVASRILDQIEAKRITRGMGDREYQRWILNTLNFKI